MGDDADKGNEYDYGEVGPVIEQHVSNEIDYWSCHNNEKDEHRDSFEEVACHCIKEKAERDLTEAY